MPARVFECLRYLIEERDRAVARDELALAVFARDNVSDVQLGQIVLRARRTVGDDGQEQRLIRTVPRFGFRWVADTRVMDCDSGPQAGPGASLAGSEPLTQPKGGPERSGDGDGDAAGYRPGRGMPAALVIVVLALTLLGGAWWAAAEREPVQNPGLEFGQGMVVIVLPTEVQAPGEVPWARLGLMDFLGNRLRTDGLPVAS